MTFRNATLSLVILFTSLTAAVAQDECELTLIKATDEFNAGHFFSIPSILAPCIKKNQNREWRQRAYLLLTQTYLLLEDPTGAKNSYLKVLQANPEYATDAQRDPIDLVYFSSKFTAAPIFSLYAYAGSNVSTVKVLFDSNIDTSDPADANGSEKKYSIRPGFQLGGGVEWHYDENLSATAEFSYMQTAYKKTSTNIFGQDKLEVTDRQSWFRLPISIKFSDHVGKFRPYGYIGFSLDYLSGDNAFITAANNDSTKIVDQQPSVTSKIQESPKLDFSPRRNQFNYSLFFGGGVKYKLGLNYVFVDLRYSSGMKSIVDPNSLVYNYGSGSLTSNELLNSGDPTFNWWHVDDIFRMKNIVLSIGYVHPLYKPRELKRAKTKSILRKIKKQDD